MRIINFCEDCRKPAWRHLDSWLDEFMSSCPLPKKLSHLGDLLLVLLEKIFVFLRLAAFEENFSLSDIEPRSACFITEARKRGLKIKVLRGPFGYTNRFLAEADGKKIRFEGLPLAESLSKQPLYLLDNKERVRRRLRREGLPVPEGKTFWFWQKARACVFGEKLGFPLVVKPRSGSFSRHITTDIKNIDQFKKAINKAVSYSPAFIVEKFIANTFVHRLTVIDFDFVACVKLTPANVTGDGQSTIAELARQKNSDPRRGEANEGGFVLHKLIINETSERLLKAKGYDLSIVPKTGEIIYLQKDPFVKLGADIIEITPKVHFENLELARRIAKLFDARVVGIDFLTQDITLSWKSQQCAILELNSLPCIELHHFPSEGKELNLAEQMIERIC